VIDLHQDDIRDAVAAYDKRMAMGNPVDKVMLAIEMLTASGMRSSRTMAQSPHGAPGVSRPPKKKEQEDGLHVASSPQGADG
jgi:hypothetical protein